MRDSKLISRRQFASSVVAGLTTCAFGDSAFKAFLATQPSYFGSFTDFDFFLLAIGANLRQYERMKGIASGVLEEVADVARRVLGKAIVYMPGGGWLLQPGAMTDHADLAYAGRTTKSPSMRPLKLPGVAMDTSHSSRWPLFITALRDSEPPGTVSHGYYGGLLHSLEHQFVSKVLVKPSGRFRFYRTTNFMDGSNGVYRWHYRSNPNDGYGPWQLTGTMLYGWWTFLATPAIRDVYMEFASSLPMSADERKIYLGPWRGLSENESQLLVELAATLAQAVELDSPITERQRVLWTLVSRPRLERQIWRSGDLQDHAYTLMLPLHSAFLARESTWQEAFANHISSWIDFGLARTEGGLLDRLHAFFLLSNFLVLARGDVTQAVARNLHLQLVAVIGQLWQGQNAPVSNYGWGEPKFPNFKTYLEWKLHLVAPWERLWSARGAYEA